MSHSFTVDVKHRDTTYTVTGEYTAGRPMRMADMHQPGEPAEPPEIEVLKLVSDDGPEPLDDDYPDLVDELYEYILIEAEDHLTDRAQAWAEDAADAKRELIREREL